MLRLFFKTFRENANTSFRLTIDGKSVSFFKEWETSVQEVKNSVFDPARKYGMFQCEDDRFYYNIWVGVRAMRRYDIEDLPTDYSEIEDVITILRNLCANDDVRYWYVINWLNALINGRKTGKCLCFVNAAGGVGKGTFWNRFIYKYVVGSEMSYSTQDKNDIVGQFNGRAIENNLLLIFDEANYTIDEFDAVKNITSERIVSVNDKHVKQRDIESFVNLVMLSNRLVPGLDDRRMIYLIPNAEFSSNDILEKFNEELDKAVTGNAVHKQLERKACMFVKYVREMSAKNPVNLNKKPRTCYSTVITYDDEYVQCIDGCMFDIYKSMEDKRKKSVPQEEVINIIKTQFEKNVMNMFDINTCHTTLLEKLGFKLGVYSSMRQMSYIIPSQETFNNLLSKHQTIIETNM